jgi:hypothetical protein
MSGHPASNTLPANRSPSSPLTNMMNTVPFTVGERVRHPRRPEWGLGNVQRIETTTVGAKRDQRLWIRFDNAGLKTILASAADLERAATISGHDEHTLVSRELSGETGWLAEISKRKPEEAMTALAPQASDPFIPALRRLEYVLNLYRFDTSGAKLIDWAVAQSGLGDPLTRFTRPELERFFADWAIERDAQLNRLLQDQELRNDPAAVRAVVESALPAAQSAARRYFSMR